MAPAKPGGHGKGGVRQNAVMEEVKNTGD